MLLRPGILLSPLGFLLIAFEFSNMLVDESGNNIVDESGNRIVMKTRI